MSGDVSLTADVQLAPASAGSHPNRKAFLMFRQTLDPDSMYADAAVHGSGETALQYRRNEGRHAHRTFTSIWALRRQCGLRSAATRSRCL